MTPESNIKISRPDTQYATQCHPGSPFLDVLTMDPPRMVGCQPSKGQTLTFIKRWSYFRALLSDLTLKAIDLGLIFITHMHVLNSNESFHLLH